MASPLHLRCLALALGQLLFLLLLPAARAQALSGDKYMLGVGKADVTGPVVEIDMMGYADLSQKGTGLRQRLFSRAFIVANVQDPSENFVYIIADLQSGDTAVRNGVLEKLAALYGDTYTKDNVAVVGTHNHNGPGAWLNYLLPQVTTLGFVPESYTAIVEGIVLSVQRAHESLAPGYLSLNKGYVSDANINRSPAAYLANPAEERAQYEGVGGDVDKEMTVLSFYNENGTAMGLLNWFPVHGTSLYENNTLIAGDNKGLAALTVEKAVGNNFVAGFSQANVGDTTPNTLGAVCQDTGLPCDFVTSTCNNRTELCMGRGPAFAPQDGGDKESCRIIATKQADGAQAIFSASNQTAVAGDGGIVRSLHTFVDFGSGYNFSLPNGTFAKTCAAAMGFSFAGGTTDGPGAFDFTQGDSGAPSNPFWLLVRDLLKTPDAEQIACHVPKPILLDVGQMTEPYAWTPNIVDIQMFRVGQLGIIISPGEATTMSGRRWRAALQDEMDKQGIVSADESWVVLGAPANTYTHYIATPEEYSVQRYEGASTLYGQHTLDAYLNLARKYTPYLAATPPSEAIEAGPTPPDNRNNSLNLNTGVVFDAAPLGKSFGDVVTDVDTSSNYATGDTVHATFVGANPRNNMRLEGTFAAVDVMNGSTWTQVRDDTDYDLTYEWVRTSTVLGTSQVTLNWTIEDGTSPGVYRLHYYGDAKAVLTGKITAFEGTSSSFTVGGITRAFGNMA